jgi:hypothetical protein
LSSHCELHRATGPRRASPWRRLNQLNRVGAAVNKPELDWFVRVHADEAHQHGQYGYVAHGASQLDDRHVLDQCDATAAAAKFQGAMTL